MNKKSLAGLLVVFGITVARMLTSPTIKTLRTVDLLLIFASGMLFGVLLVSFLGRLRARRSSP
jgi:hypothetical protein